MFQESFLGTVTIFAGKNVPNNWMFCQGQLLSIGENSALFSVIGTTYGGDGINNFALPNLCGRTAVGMGQAPKMQPYTMGQTGGNEQITVSIANLPSHTHALDGTINIGQPCSTTVGQLSTPEGNFPAPVNSAPAAYNTAPQPGSIMGVTSINGVTAGGPDYKGSQQTVEVLSPYLAMNYIICIAGIYPSQG